MSVSRLGIAASPVPPSRLFRRNLAVVVVGSAALAIAGIGLGFRPWMLVTEFHHLVRLAGEMLPPNIALLWRKPGLFETIGTTLAMTFLGTVTSCLLAFVLALVAARNTTLHPVLRSVTRVLFGLERATPNFVVLLVLFISFGYGPFAAMIALAIGSIGMFGKLFADAIEEVEAGPCEAVELVGAGRWQVIRYAVMPQLLPVVVGRSFYAFDVNLRAAIALGVYGGGGVGFELQLAMKVLRYADAFALILLIIVLITGMERVSDAVRRRLLPEGVLK